MSEFFQTAETNPTNGMLKNPLSLSLEIKDHFMCRYLPDKSVKCITKVMSFKS